VLLAADDMKALRELAKRSAKLPSQGVASTFAPLNIHTQPAAPSPSFIQLKENDKVDVLQSVLLPRTDVPRTPLIPPAPKKTKAPSKPKKEPRIPLPPMPKPPPLPEDWVELSRSERADEEAAAAEFLLDRVVHGHRRLRVDTLVIDVGRDADDPPRIGTDADELHDAVGPRQMPVDRILTGEQRLGDVAADDDHFLGVVVIRVGEVPSGDERHAERGKVSRRDRPEVRARIVLAILLLQPLNRERESKTEVARVPPGHLVGARDVEDTGQDRHAPLHVAVELTNLIWRAAIRHFGHVHRKHVVRLEPGVGGLQRDQRLQQHARAREQHERPAPQHDAIDRFSTLGSNCFLFLG